MNYPKVYIILLNYNGKEDTIECLESLLKLDYPNFQIVIVDNNSTDSSIQYLQDWSKGLQQVNSSTSSAVLKHIYPYTPKPLKIITLGEVEPVEIANTSIVLIQAKENKGFSAGNNLGIKYTLGNKDADYVWLLNNDTVVPRGTLKELVRTYEPNVKLGLVGSRLLEYEKPEIQQAFAGKFVKSTCTPVHIGENEHIDHLKSHSPQEYDYVLGASMFVPLNFIEEVGLLDEGYFLYFEELDWTLRGKKLGWDTKVNPNAFIYHKRGSSTGNNNAVGKSLFADIIIIRSKIRFLRKHYPFLLVIPFLMFPIVAYNRIRRGQSDRIFPLFKALVYSLIGK